MSDLSQSLARLAQSATQLPVSSYFDEALYQREMERIFQRCPRYLGHELCVPQVGDFHTLAHEGEGRVMLRTPAGVEVLSNVCRHRQAIMLKGRGHTGNNIVCPLHRWTYNATGGQAAPGELIGAPHFPQDPCLNLPRTSTQAWNGLLFEAPTGRDAGPTVAQSLASIGPGHDLSFEGYVFDRAIQHECDYNWKSFIEVYLEDYHVGPFHPGLGNFVTCDDLRWEFSEHHSVQTVGVARHNGEALGKPGTDTYRLLHEKVLALSEGRPPKHGAIWLTLYPTVMVEWYPHVLTVSTLYPKGPQKTLNVVEFFYPEEISAFEREFIEAQQAAYMETCVEDDEIALRMDAGRKALWQRGDDDAGPYQSPMEDGMQHFHEWYRRMMGWPAGQDWR
jgi:phenylpropionate dioxygenase-like ring-hydroxylating dioxygenase large terminal subunit